MKYITYLTIYSGDKLPPFYIGSTSLKKHLNGYTGTVVSKAYEKIYKAEKKSNPELFDTILLEEFDSREEATSNELHYQKLHDVVRSNLFMNMAFAAPNGCFGMDTSGKNHPLYGTHNGKGNIHSYNPTTLEQAFLPYIPEGNIEGRSPNYKACPHNKGKKWYNNGMEHKMIHPDKVPEGWVKGKLPGAASRAATKMWERIRNENSTPR